jgi:four helix bundle protein
MQIERSSFKRLRVYQLAEKLADQIWSAVVTWDFFAKDTVGKQVVRATDSIGANITEGMGRRSFVENRRFVRMARGSSNETRHWLNAYLRSMGEIVQRDRDENRWPKIRARSLLSD